MQCTARTNFLHKKISYLHALQENREMGARYLDPKYSRWISTDPALGEYVPGAGKANTKDVGGLPGMGGLFNCVNLNLFHYAGNNPIKYTDPDGRVDWNEIDQEVIDEVKRTFNGDFGADFFSISKQAYNNGDFFSGFVYSLDGTAELFFDLFGIYKLAQGIGYLVDKIGVAFSTSSLSAATTTATANISAESAKLLDQLDNFTQQKIEHILNGSKGHNHFWEKLVPDKNWDEVKALIVQTMEKGTESSYGSAFKNTLDIRGETIEVTFQKLADGTKPISDAWVKN